MKKIIVVAIATVVLSACGTTIHTVQINPATIDFVEHRTFWSTTAVAIVRDGEKIIGIGSGTGKPIASLVGDVATGAMIAGSLGFIGSQLPKVNTGTSQVEVIGAP